eukprot:INCI1332.1.p1 GENE.INCI1332.1~~INCI1332.1.p1  ORF type:complete len:741 (+),score=180.98 INCI1332.1:167-2389(+)
MSSVAADAAAVIAAATAAAGGGERFDIAAAAAPAVSADYTRYFDVVTKDPADFSSWTLLLKSCDSEQYNAIAKAFDAFLSEYPFCYGYWKKYADHTQRDAAAKELGPEPVIAIYERGVAAVRHSVDMWGHYCNFMSSMTMEMTTVEAVRAVYRRAIEAVGASPLANTNKTNQLWNSLLRFEMEVSHDVRQLAEVYHLLLRTPFRGFSAFWVRYEEWASSPAANFDAPEGSVSDAALERLKQDATVEGTLPDGFAELPRSQQIVQCAKILHDAAKVIEQAREPLETPLGFYFHVKPLSDAEMAGWRAYLAFEQAEEEKAAADASLASSPGIRGAAAARARTETLFERAVIRCANYPEMWLAYATYKIAHLEAGSCTAEDVLQVYHRCSHVHLKRQPLPRLACAEFLETQGRIDEARSEHHAVAGMYPTLIQAALARANFERRQGQKQAAHKALEEALEANIQQATKLQAEAAQAAKAAKQAAKQAAKEAAEAQQQSNSENPSEDQADSGDVPSNGNEEADDDDDDDDAPNPEGTDASAFLAVQLANFQLHVNRDVAAARATFTSQLAMHVSSADFVSAYVAFEMAHTGAGSDEIDGLIARLVAPASKVPLSLKVSLWRRRVELAEDFGPLDVKALIALRKERDAAVAALEMGATGAAPPDASGAAGPTKRNLSETGGVAKKSRTDAAATGHAAYAQQQQQQQQQQDPALAAQWAAYYAQQAAYGGQTQGYAQQQQGYGGYR